MFLLKLHPAFGSVIAIFSFIAFTSCFFFIAHIFLGGKRPNQTKTFAQQMALRIGTLHALIIAFVFGALATDYIDLEKTLDNEAAAVGSVYMALTKIQTEDAEKIRNKFALYLKDVIDKEWGQTPERPLSTSTGKILIEIMKDLGNLQTSLPFEEKIKNYSIDMMFKINEMRVKRLYGWFREDIPVIFWLIALVGFILTLFPYLSVELTRFRLILINCYSAMVGVTFYGIVLLNNPFMCGLVAPTPHTMILEQIKTYPSSSGARVPTSDNMLSKRFQSDRDSPEKTINIQ